MGPTILDRSAYFCFYHYHALNHYYNFANIIIIIIIIINVIIIGSTVIIIIIIISYPIFFKVDKNEFPDEEEALEEEHRFKPLKGLYDVCQSCKICSNAVREKWC